MKFSKLTESLATGLRLRGGLGQLVMVSAIGLLVATFLAACQLVTIDYVFVAAAGSGTSNGTIDTYAADSQSGALRKGAATVSSGGVNPVAIAVSADYSNMYVAHTGSNTVVHFAIAPSGVLTSKDTITLAGPPTSLAVNSAGTYLYVVSGSNTATLTEYALTSGSGAIGSPAAEIPLQIPGFETDAVVPTGVAVLANNSQIQGAAVFATLYDQSAYNPGGTTTSTAHPGWVFGFSIGSGGALAAAAGSPYQAGVKPSALVTDPTDRFVYVTDYASNQLIGYGIHSGSTLSFLINGPFRTGNEPQSIAVDPRGKYLYVANALDSSVSAFVIDLSTGTPSAAVNPTGSSVNSTDTQPLSIAVDPALGRFVYTANYIGDSVSGFRLDPNAGNLSATQATPYPSDQKPTAIAIVPHGNHSTQSVTP